MRGRAGQHLLDEVPQSLKVGVRSSARTLLVNLESISRQEVEPPTIDKPANISSVVRSGHGAPQ